jgi:hypothetical protein
MYTGKVKLKYHTMSTRKDKVMKAHSLKASVEVNR